MAALQQPAKEGRRSTVGVVLSLEATGADKQHQTTEEADLGISQHVVCIERPGGRGGCKLVDEWLGCSLEAQRVR